MGRSAGVLEGQGALPADRLLRFCGPTAVVMWVGVVGPVLRASNLPDSMPYQVLVVGSLAALGAVSFARLPWFLRALIPAAAAATLVMTQGTLIALWMGLGLTIGGWVATGSAPLPRIPKPAHGSTGPVLVLSAVSIWRGADPSATWQPFVPLMLAGAVPLLGYVGGGAIHRAARRVGDIAAHSLSAVLFGTLAILTVLVPWAGQRPLRIDPLATRAGWMERQLRPLHADRAWARDPVPDSRPLVVRLRGTAAVLAVSSMLFGALWYQRMDRPATQDATTIYLERDNRSSAPKDWYREYREDIGFVLDEKVAWRPFEAYRIWDVATRHVNVRDGARVSWTAPTCDCRRLTIWIYGGSAVFGLEQRDDHTIASELARLAYENGLTVDVVNRGLPGQLHWRNAFRFAYDLTYDSPPDLAIFYDGADEVDSALLLSERGMGDTRAPFEPLAEQLYESLFDGLPARFPNQILTDLGWPTVSDVPADEQGRLAVIRYDRHRELSRSTTESWGVPVRYFWQPTRYSHDGGATTGAPTAPEAGSQERARAFASASSLLGDDVIDLSGALDGIDEPVFLDEVHHDERGARIVAKAIYEELSRELASLAAGPDS